MFLSDMFKGRRWRRLTIAGLMVVIALSAGLINWIRPLSRSEAIGVAEARFRKIPGSAKWSGRYKVNAWWAGDFWFVDFTDAEGGGMLAQIPVTPKGKLRGVGVNTPKFKEAAPQP